MKKGLSILLVAAALFGFYGSAVNLNDVLACKDYWEKAGEESTANMNKLEDGLNQLKENEQAYLDGQDQLAEGEKTLADGEAALADGEAQYAQGLADYEAAPAKLADAREKIAAGEAELQDGQDAIDGLTQLINGIKQIRGGYNDSWRPGYEALKGARKQLFDSTKGSKKDLTDLAAFLPDDRQKAYVAAVSDVAGDDSSQSAKDYKTFIDSTNNLAKNLPVIKKVVEKSYNDANNLYTLLKAQQTNFDFAKVASEQKEGLLSLKKLIAQANGKEAAETYEATVNAVADAYDNFDDTVDLKYDQYMSTDEGKQTEAYLIAQNTADDSDAMKQGWAQFWESDNGKAALAQILGVPVASLDAVPDDAKAQAKAGFKASETGKQVNAQIKKQIEPMVKEAVDAGIKENVKQKVLEAYEDPAGDLTKAKYGLTVDYTIDEEDDTQDGGVVGIVVNTLKAVNEKVNGKGNSIDKLINEGLTPFNAQVTDSKVDALSDGQNTVAGGVATVASAVLGNETLRSGVQKNFGSQAIALLNAYKSSNSPLSTGVSNFAAFEAQMDQNPGINGFLKKAQDLLTQTRADGLKKLAAGKKKLANGKAQYAQGLADYEAAPGKLADAEKQLADGRQQLEDGRQALADGKAKLAEYEDGEQQVRDGLKTLTDTEADLDLKSIADRLNGDVDFDNGDTHLELDEGLAAVEVGRGYQAEDGVLITDEIMARAVGTGALLGAGVLAVLAAILSFLKKNKGAGVFAILAAAAGAFGAFYGTQAGTYFSSIAGSTVGATGWIAAGILGAVALVHAIVHFTAKPEA